MIKLTNVDFAYSWHKSIFTSLDIELDRGRIYGLLGCNGSGKSTLLKIISGVISPSKGEVLVDGVDPADRLPSLTSQIYYIPEDISIRNSSMATYAKYMTPFYPNYSDSDLRSYLEEFGVSYTDSLDDMSLGQRKKAVIAFALACNTRILIMDEPTNGLDIPSKSQFRKIVSRIASEERTVIISTHQVRDLDSLIDSIIILDDSKILVNASMRRISERLQFRRLDAAEESIYEESNMMGRWGVVENMEEGGDAKVDLELLFKASIAEPQKINES
ncbi:MAG: ATP-binding cassette domain-containing protein [Rikenellaceae bacterium]